MSTRLAVAVVGAGASGTLAAAQLAKAATASGVTLDVALIDPRPAGQGLAYSTSDPRHRLNVMAKGMSAWPDDPGHFVRWLRRHVDADFPETGYAPRPLYARYLGAVLEHAVEDSPRVRLDRVSARAIGLRRQESALLLDLDDGTSRLVDGGVLALGHGQPSTAWAPDALCASPLFVADPWSADHSQDRTASDQSAAGARLRRGDEVVLVGAGLTAVDMALRWGSEGVRVHVVSRHGMVPLPHASSVSAPPPTAAGHIGAAPATLAGLRRLVFQAIRDADGDWRRAVDGLRPVTARLWRELDTQERQAFVATAARRWDRVRHRIDPSMSTWLRQRLADGSLVVHAATVADAHPTGARLQVVLSDGARIDAAAVINCTGAGGGVSDRDDPLVAGLLACGLARPGPLDLGFATDAAGRLLPGRGPDATTASSGTRGVSAPLWTLGPLRRGELWESTAVPEIREQAAELAGEIIADLGAGVARHVGK